MRFIAVAAVGMLLALPTSQGWAGDEDLQRAVSSPEDPIAAATDQAVVPVSNPEVLVNVSAQHVPPARRTRASLIVYTPNGTMLRTRPRDVRKAQAKFRLSFRSTPVSALQRGTYTVYATVEAGSQAFGMPTSFEIADD